jgi:hypothetical protein
MRSPLGAAMPEQAADAAYRFEMDMEAQIAAYRKENKDPRVLLDPLAREYLLKPERISAFMIPTGKALADGAAKAPGGPIGRDNVKPGEVYADAQGIRRVRSN